MFRKTLFAGVALAAMLSASGAFADKRLATMDTPTPAASGGAVTPFYGSINPFYGSINPFYGSINPFYGSINPFYGSINPFYGQINPFWGNVTPFWGTINPFYGTINPFYGTINPFWGKTDPFAGNTSFFSQTSTFWQGAGPQWGGINTAWNTLQASNATDYSSIQSQFSAFLSSAGTFWSPAMQKDMKKSDFMTFYANPLMAEYGIDPTNAASLANVSPQARSAFFLDFYDGLMNYSGQDHVDWWMAAVHWSPQLAQIQGSANNASVGILDSYTTAHNADVNLLTFAGGYKNNVLDHGAAVASLIAAKQDGYGVMGVAPNATVQVLYNPFDATGTAGWSDVATGIATLFSKKASVINASLGVPGAVLTSEWSSILNSSSVVSSQHQLVLVKAAGNEGVMQSADVPWSGAAPTNLLLVGSVDPNNTISSFSNTPGEACITTADVCLEQNKLKYRYLVAPGELLLVEDNHGDVTRASGTSFAAPLVTGAVSLLQDRWPWLQQHADETVQIILQSATDLGAPGVDPIYGWGELNIEASQSPLNFNNLTVYTPTAYSASNNGNSGNNGNNDNNGNDNGNGNCTGNVSCFSTATAAGSTPTSLKASVLAPGQLALWQQQGAYVVAFENIGSTYRDFTIPLSSLLIGKSVGVNGNTNPFQSYLYQRLIDWSNGVKTLNFNSQSMFADTGEWRVGLTTTESSPDETQHGAGPLHTEFVATNTNVGLTVRMGEGNGAHALAGDNGFVLRSDFDPSTGGVNPVLGFASGGGYAQTAVALAQGLTVSVGYSQKSDDHTIIDPTFGPLQQSPLSTNRASASVASIDYTVVKGIKLNLAYTYLDERDGLLGSQGSGIFNMAGGARTEGTTLGATAMLGDGWHLSGSATLARTTGESSGSALTIGRGGLQSTAYELVAGKTGILGEDDQFRVSIAQPLHVESGALQYHSLEVVDRSTGALGVVTQNWSISGKREYRMEATYGVPVLEGRAEINGFGLLDLNPPTRPDSPVAVTLGAQFKLGL